MNFIRAFLKALSKISDAAPKNPDYNASAMRAELERDEGLRLKMYEDSLGIPTVGIGHNMRKPISKAAAEQIYLDDLADAEADLDRTWPTWRTSLTPRRRRVLLNLMFNMGLPTFGAGPDGFLKFWTAAKTGEIETSALELVDSKWYGQVKARGPRIVKMWREG